MRQSLVDDVLLEQPQPQLASTVVVGVEIRRGTPPPVEEDGRPRRRSHLGLPMLLAMGQNLPEGSDNPTSRPGRMPITPADVHLRLSDDVPGLGSAHGVEPPSAARRAGVPGPAARPLGRRPRPRRRPVQPASSSSSAASSRPAPADCAGSSPPEDPWRYQAMFADVAAAAQLNRHRTRRDTPRAAAGCATSRASAPRAAMTRERRGEVGEQPRPPQAPPPDDYAVAPVRRTISSASSADQISHCRAPDRAHRLLERSDRRPVRVTPEYACATVRPCRDTAAAPTLSATSPAST